MKLNNKGFAVSTIMYMILIMAVILITLTLTLLSSRKLILDKSKYAAKETIYNIYSISYREALSILKSEAIVYANENDIEKDSIKIENLNSSIDKEILDAYELSEKYLTMVSNNNLYDVYLGRSNVVSTNVYVNEMIDIIDYTISGNSVQNGTPTPDAPIEIESVGDLVTDSSDTNYGKYKIPIKISTKNLIDYSGTYTVKDTNYNGNFKKVVVDVPTGKTITASADIDATAAYGDENTVSITLTYSDGTTEIIRYWNNTSIKIGKGKKGKAYTSITVQKDVKEIIFTIHAFNKDGGSTVFSNFQLEIGSLSDFEPYEKPITTNIYLDEPLRKVREQSDSIDFIDQELVRENKSAKVYSDNYYAYNLNLENIKAYRTDGGLYSDSNKSNVYDTLNMSNKFKYLSGAAVSTISETTGEVLALRNGTLYITIGSDKLEDFSLSNVKEYINGLNAEIIYQLATPSHIDTYLPKLPTLNGISELSIDTSILPSNVEFTVIQKIKQL